MKIIGRTIKLCSFSSLNHLTISLLVCCFVCLFVCWCILYIQLKNPIVWTILVIRSDRSIDTRPLVRILTTRLSIHTHRARLHNTTSNFLLNGQRASYRALVLFGYQKCKLILNFWFCCFVLNTWRIPWICISKRKTLKYIELELNRITQVSCGPWEPKL